MISILKTDEKRTAFALALMKAEENRHLEWQRVLVERQTAFILHWGKSWKCRLMFLVRANWFIPFHKRVLYVNYMLNCSIFILSLISNSQNVWYAYVICMLNIRASYFVPRVHGRGLVQINRYAWLSGSVTHPICPERLEYLWYCGKANIFPLVSFQYSNLVRVLLQFTEFFALFVMLFSVLKEFLTFSYLAIRYAKHAIISLQSSFLRATKCVHNVTSSVERDTRATNARSAAIPWRLCCWINIENYSE